jgi:hypothetical protein
MRAFVLATCLLMLIGCTNEMNNTQNIEDLTKELKIKEIQFNALKIPYDEYENIYNKLYPKEAKLENKVLIAGIIEGKELKGLDVHEMMTYVANKVEIDLEEVIKAYQYKDVEVKLSEVLSGNTSEQYYVFWTTSIEIQNKKVCHTGYYQYERIHGEYKIINEEADHLIYPEHENKFSSLSEAKNSLKYQEWKGKEIVYSNDFKVELND